MDEQQQPASTASDQQQHEATPTEETPGRSAPAATDADPAAAQSDPPAETSEAPTPHTTPRPDQLPSIGRIVRYVMPDGTVRPAIITHVEYASEGVVDLYVFRDGRFDPSAHEFLAVPINVRFFDAAVMQPRTWHWPPRV